MNRFLNFFLQLRSSGYFPFIIFSICILMSQKESVVRISLLMLLIFVIDTWEYMIYSLKTSFWCPRFHSMYLNDFCIKLRKNHELSPEIFRPVIYNLSQNWAIFNTLFFYFSEIPKMDLNTAVNTVMAFKASSVSSKTKLSRSGIFQLPSLGIKLIVILQIISIQINIHSVTGKLSIIIIDYRLMCDKV